MNKIPCEECISLAICIQQIKQLTHPRDLTTYSMMVECDPLADYIKYIGTLMHTGNKDQAIIEIEKGRKIFRLPKLPHLRNPPRDLVVLDQRLYEKGIIQIVSHNNCDCNVLEYNKKDCEHEIIAGNEPPKPPKRV